MDQLIKNIRNVVIGTGIASLVLGAVRGYQETNGLVTDPTLDSCLIATATLGPIGLGAIVGAAAFTPVALNDNYSGIVEKSGMVVGGASIGATVEFIPACSGTSIGYTLGKLIGYVSSKFV